MEAIRLLLLALLLATFMKSIHTIEFLNPEQPFSIEKEYKTIGEGTITKTIAEIEKKKNKVITEPSLDAKVILSMCANRFIKSCENNEQCRQIICQAKASQEVRIIKF